MTIIDDKIKKIKKPTMTAEEMQTIRDEGEAAKELLEDPRFEFFRTYLRNQKEAIVTDFVNNKIRKVTVVQKGEIEDREIEFTKEEQEHEKSGKFKFIFELIENLQYVASLASKAEEAQEKGTLVIET